MNSLILFVSITACVAVAVLLIALGSPKSAFAYLKENPRVSAGILAFVGIGLALGLASKAFSEPLRWFEYGEVFLGIDQTKGVSPQCEAVGPDDRLTSNGGVKANILQSYDKKTELNLKYTHHSCALNEDRNGYDAFGLEVTYRLW